MERIDGTTPIRLDLSWPLTKPRHLFGSGDRHRSFHGPVYHWLHFCDLSHQDALEGQHRRFLLSDEFFI